MRITPAIILDTIFTAFVSFILIFVLTNFYITRLPAITLSITLASILALLTFIKLRSAKAKEKLSRADKKAKTFMVNQLNIYSQTQQNDLFERALKVLGYKTERKKGGIFIKDERIAIFPKFSFDALSKTDVVKVFNNAGREDLIYIFCNEFSPEIKNFADRFDGRISLISADKTYKFLTENDCMPKEKFAFPERKKLKLTAFKNLIKKEQSKRLMFFGLTLLLTSYFVPIKAYYIIFGGIFLFLSLICRLYGTSTPKNV